MSRWRTYCAAIVIIAEESLLSAPFFSNISELTTTIILSTIAGWHWTRLDFILKPAHSLWKPLNIIPRSLTNSNNRVVLQIRIWPLAMLRLPANRVLLSLSLRSNFAQLFFGERQNSGKYLVFQRFYCDNVEKMWAGHGSFL